MADWTRPELTDTYQDFLALLKARDEDAGTLFAVAPSGQPVGSFRYVRASDKFQEWNGTIWVDKVLSVAGGGTGATSPGGIRAVLGLGTMSTQDSNAVNITGGNISGNGAGLTNLNASALTTGTVPTARLGSGVANASTFLRGDQTWAPLSVDLPYGADQAVPFNAVPNTAYNLIYASGNYVALPSVVGNGGKIIILIQKSANANWSVYPNGVETLLGVNPYPFDWPLYSAIVLKADSNNGKWDII